MLESLWISPNTVTTWGDANAPLQLQPQWRTSARIERIDDEQASATESPPVTDGSEDSDHAGSQTNSIYATITSITKYIVKPCRALFTPGNLVLVVIALVWAIKPYSQAQMEACRQHPAYASRCDCGTTTIPARYSPLTSPSPTPKQMPKKAKPAAATRKHATVFVSHMARPAVALGIVRIFRFAVRSSCVLDVGMTRKNAPDFASKATGFAAAPDSVMVFRPAQMDTVLDVRVTSNHATTFASRKIKSAAARDIARVSRPAIRTNDVLGARLTRRNATGCVCQKARSAAAPDTTARGVHSHRIMSAVAVERKSAMGDVCQMARFAAVPSFATRARLAVKMELAVDVVLTGRMQRHVYSPRHHPLRFRILPKRSVKQKDAMDCVCPKARSAAVQGIVRRVESAHQLTHAAVIIKMNAMGDAYRKERFAGDLHGAIQTRIALCREGVKGVDGRFGVDG
ncbi:hypothetical protein B0J13DRAFT_529087 [Dactylonectria estremocensis]|uniref:Uncharacterized protein n=1 Tax=Dactylonectria estremocensis TaxID=1079267 RepID=A0A9P9E918_9HYPO|nr:hypothetical protein B0J13DRAFT_529087 [Dactylonectria estremocensis]